MKSNGREVLKKILRAIKRVVLSIFHMDYQIENSKIEDNSSS